MDLFQQAGQAQLLRAEGQRALAAAVLAKLRAWFAELHRWHAAMPGTLPPTEFRGR